MIKKLAMTLALSFLVLGFATPAVAAPCCQDCPGWDDGEPINEFCFLWCRYCFESDALLDLSWQHMEPIASTTTDNTCVDLVAVDLELPAPSPEVEKSPA